MEARDRSRSRDGGRSGSSRGDVGKDGGCTGRGGKADGKGGGGGKGGKADKGRGKAPAPDGRVEIGRVLNMCRRIEYHQREIAKIMDGFVDTYESQMSPEQRAQATRWRIDGDWWPDAYG